MFISKCICDFCGKECEHEEYILPMFETKTICAKTSTGEIAWVDNDEKLVIKSIDMCDDCKIQTARLMKLLKFTDLNKCSIILGKKQDVCENDRE